MHFQRVCQTSRTSPLRKSKFIDSSLGLLVHLREVPHLFDQVPHLLPIYQLLPIVAPANSFSSNDLDGTAQYSQYKLDT